MKVNMNFSCKKIIGSKEFRNCHPHSMLLYSASLWQKALGKLWTHGFSMSSPYLLEVNALKWARLSWILSLESYQPGNVNWNHRRGYTMLWQAVWDCLSSLLSFKLLPSLLPSSISKLYMPVNITGFGLLFCHVISLCMEQMRYLGSSNQFRKKEKLTLAHGFGGFNPWLLGPLWRKHKCSKLLISWCWKAKRKKKLMSTILFEDTPSGPNFLPLGSTF